MAAETKPGTQQQEYRYPGSNELTIESANSRLGPVVFNPTKSKLRARFNKGSMIGDEHVASTDMLPDGIPGQRITINIRERRAVIFDPLELPEYRDMLATITAANRSTPMGKAATYYPRETYENLTNSEIKTWLYEIRKLLDQPTHMTPGWGRDNRPERRGGPLAILIDGKIPTRQEIEDMPGELHCNFFSNSHNGPKVRKREHERAIV